MHWGSGLRGPMSIIVVVMAMDVSIRKDHFMMMMMMAIMATVPLSTTMFPAAIASSLFVLLSTVSSAQK